ncbi:MAG: response regulator transcription factor [Arcobacteraceae bacterium]
MKLLIIEDDLNILSVLRKAFEENNHIVDFTENGDQGEYLASVNKYDVIILDWMLPSKNGIEILKSMRLEKNNTPVLMLTAKDQIKDKIEGLQIGSDDYMTKPFVLEELEARVEALHRRYINNYTSDIIQFQDVVINTISKVVLKNNVELKLSSKELNILLLLLENKNTFVSKSMIEDMIYNTEKIISSNVISVTIHNLRKKIGDDIITNFRGLGYKIEI